MYQAGLVLEGGGMRGLFTAGVLDFFLDAGIDFSDCIGVSAGAGHACSYVCGQRGRALDVSVNFLHHKQYCGLYSLVTTGDLFGAEMVYKTIPEKHYPLDVAHFKNSLTSFYVVVTNCVTGEAEYIRITDPMMQIDFVRASASLPLVSKLVRLNGKLYLDGGMADSIPLEKSRAMGNKKNVVVLTQDAAYRKNPDSLYPLMKVKYRKYPALLLAMERRPDTYNRTLEEIAKLEKQGELFVIRPQSAVKIGRVEKDAEKLKLLYSQGYRQAQVQADALFKYLTI